MRTGTFLCPERRRTLSLLLSSMRVFDAPCLPPIGAEGNAARLPAFLNVARVVTAGANNDHFDQ